MSIVIALFVVLIVGGIIVNLKSHKTTTPLAQGEILIAEETAQSKPTPVQEVVEAPKPTKPKAKRGPKKKAE